MAVKIFNCNLNGGDAVTADNDLTYRIYGSTDSYTTPIATKGSHNSDSDVTVTGDVVVLNNVNVGSETSFKISSVDENGNESVLSDAFTALAYGIRISGSDNYVIIDDDSYPSIALDPKTLEFGITVNPTDFSVDQNLFDYGDYGGTPYGLLRMEIKASTGIIDLVRSDASAANLETITTTTALTAGQENTVLLDNGVLTVNGVNQNIDISGWASVTSGTTANHGFSIFSTNVSGTDGFVGDCPYINYKGNIAVMTSGGVTIPTITLDERGTKTMVLM